MGRISEFPYRLNPVICNIMFMKQGSRLVTYVAGYVKSTVDYIMVWLEDKAKVIPSEECVPKHKLFVMDMRFNTIKRCCKKFEPRMYVWKLKEERCVRNTEAWPEIS